MAAGQLGAALMAVYRDEGACYTLSGAKRNQGTDVLELPKAFLGKAVEMYISVISEDRQSVSNSLYIGLMVVT